MFFIVLAFLNLLLINYFIKIFSSKLDEAIAKKHDKNPDSDILNQLFLRLQN